LCTYRQRVGRAGIGEGGRNESVIGSAFVKILFGCLLDAHEHVLSVPDAHTGALCADKKCTWARQMRTQACCVQTRNALGCTRCAHRRAACRQEMHGAPSGARPSWQFTEVSLRAHHGTSLN